MSAEFTDGPWHCGGEHKDVSGDVLYVGEITAGGDYRGAIANVQSCDHIPNGISREEAEANARLIAAAPDLFNALEDLVNMLEVLDRPKGPLYRQAEAALAKARGTPC